MVKSTARLTLPLFVLLTTSCAGLRERPPPEEVVTYDVPAQDATLRACAPRPKKAGDDSYSVAEFIARLGGAYDDCHDTLYELNAWLDDARARARQDAADRLRQRKAAEP